MYTAPNVIMLYHHAKLEDDRMLSLIVEWINDILLKICKWAH